MDHFEDEHDGNLTINTVCIGCNKFCLVNGLNLCDECFAKLERDLIRAGIWEYSATASTLSEDQLAALHERVLREYGTRYELIKVPNPQKPNTTTVAIRDSNINIVLPLLAHESIHLSRTPSGEDICDVFNEAGKPTGRTVVRGTQLGQEEYYLAVQIWIRNELGQYLIQQRSPHLLSGPGIWATTAGYVLTGETSLMGAIREVHEELGLKLIPNIFNQFDRIRMNNLMQDIWLADVALENIGNPNIGVEVSDWKWAFKSEIKQMIVYGQFFAYSYFDRLPE